MYIYIVFEIHKICIDDSYLWHYVSIIMFGWIRHDK